MLPYVRIRDGMEFNIANAPVGSENQIEGNSGKMDGRRKTVHPIT